MSEKFHSMDIACPICSKPSTIKDVMFSINGSILFSLICVLCGKELEYVTSWAKMVCFCAEKELTVAQVHEGNLTKH